MKWRLTSDCRTDATRLCTCNWPRFVGKLKNRNNRKGSLTRPFFCMKNPTKSQISLQKNSTLIKNRLFVDFLAEIFRFFQTKRPKCIKKTIKICPIFDRNRAKINNYCKIHKFLQNPLFPFLLFSQRKIFSAKKGKNSFWREKMLRTCRPFYYRFASIRVKSELVYRKKSETEHARDLSRFQKNRFAGNLKL